MQLLKDILPFVYMAGLTVYFVIVHNKRMTKLELKNRYLKLFAISESGNPYAIDAYKFQKEFTDKELKKLGFTEQEIDALRSTGPGPMLNEIVHRSSRLLSL